MNGHKLSRKLRTYGLIAAATAAASLLLGYFLGAFDSEPRGHIDADSVCSNLFDKQEAAKILNSALPKSTQYDFRERLNTPPDYSYRINCEVIGDRDNAFLDLTAAMGFSAPWKRWESQVLKPHSKGKITHFEAGIKGVSASNLAGIYVPCYTSERSSKQSHNLNVFALAIEPLQGSERENRQKLIDLALDYAHNAHKQAKCDRPSKLPDHVTAPDE